MGRYIYMILFIIESLLTYQYYLKPYRNVAQLNKKDIVQFLSSTVFGQEAAIDIVAHALQTHTKNLENGIYKPLILSFHGSSGVGKTFMSYEISRFLNCTDVLKFHPSMHIQNGDFKITTSNCDWDIFIVEDAKQFTGKSQEIFKRKLRDMKGTWQERRLIVIFLSDLYGSEINDVIFGRREYQWQSTFLESDFASIVKRGPSNFFVELHKESLLDAFVPFLPLGRNSVVKCIQQELKRVKQVPYKEIAEEIFSHVMMEKNLYSKSGCKTVHDKVVLWLNSKF